MQKPAPLNKIRFSRIILITGILALLVQMVIVSYNAFTGFIRVESLPEYLFRIIYAAFFTTLMGLAIVFPDLIVINRLNNRYSWSRAPMKRVALQAIFTLLIASAASTAGTMLVHSISSYASEWPGILVTNALIAFTINILLMTALEAWEFFRESRLVKIRNEKLQNELAVIRFEVLKNQINPHFMFNSLNVLSGLIQQDPGKAQAFIEAFARVYHYVLETIEKPVVSVEEELQFARSYMHLQQIRYGGHLTFIVDIPAGCLELLMPPLSLQVALENALKHNITGPSHPLQIRLTCDQEWMEIRNGLQPKASAVPSTGIGQKNLAKRYAMVCDRRPEYRIENDQYLVKLPVIPCED